MLSALSLYVSFESLFAVGKHFIIFFNVNMNTYLHKFIINKKLTYKKEKGGVVEWGREAS